MKTPDVENTQHNTQGVSGPVLEMSAHIADLQHQADTLSALKAKKGPASPEAKDASGTTPSATVSPARCSSCPPKSAQASTPS
jgi:hypothetical protein